MRMETATVQWHFIECWDDIPTGRPEWRPLVIDVNECGSCRAVVGPVSTDVPGAAEWVPVAFVVSGEKKTLLCEDCCAVLSEVSGDGYVAT